MKNTFVARIFDSSEQIFQDVICYLKYIDGNHATVEIKMPLYIQPSGINDDVSVPLMEEFSYRLDEVIYTLAPTNQYIAP